MSATRYVIVCPARSGSTMLTWFLQSHPDVCAHAEVFGLSGMLELYGLAKPPVRTPLETALRRLRDDDQVRFLRDVVFEPGGRRAVGLKFKYEELLLSRWAKARRHLERDRGVHVIHLTRRNLLERYLSQYLATEVTKVFNVTAESDRPDEPVVTLDPAVCRADFAQTLEREARVRQLFTRHPVLELTYEELVAGKEAALGTIQKFLGLEPAPLEARSIKLRTRPLTDAIANFDDLSRAFAGTAYEWMLSGDANGHPAGS